MYRLLIADDEQLERDALRFIVHKGSSAVSEVAFAANGREAISRAEEFSPDIAFLDIKMPGVNGIEAARKIKQLVPGVRIVFLTAFDYFEYAHEAIRIGVDDYLVKPASEARVLEVISRVTTDLDRVREQRQRSERNEQKLGQVSGNMETKLAESLSRGFVDSRTLAELFDFLELEFGGAAVISARLNFDLYPMRVESEAQELVLRKRCLHGIRGSLTQPGTVVIGAVVPDGVSVIVAFPKNSSGGGEAGMRDRQSAARQLADRLTETSGRIQAEFSVGATFGLSNIGDDITRLDELVVQSRELLDAAIPGDSAPVHRRAADEARGKREEPSGRNAARRRPSAALAVTRPEEPAYRFPPEAVERRLIQAIVTANAPDADQAIDDLFGWFAARSADQAALTDSIAEFVIVLRHSLSRALPGFEYRDDRFSRELSQVARGTDMRTLLRSQARKMIQTVLALPASTVPAAVTRTSDYIETHFAEDLSLELLASLTGHSVYHLSRLFKQHTGVNLVEFMTAVRIRHARALLDGGNLTIKEISARTGFSDPAYFARVFHRIEGTTPTRYRERSLRPRS
ncbi:MAG TPA: response regulator [Spirochaetia bacterium]|nr:response regulator [Spirochaetia bacterium]